MRRLPIMGGDQPKVGSVVVYRGPSRLNGEPIVAILTGLGRPSKNAKTGPMAQLWILPLEEAPHVASREGRDQSVCGDCPRRRSVAASRGLTKCYVRPHEAPRSVWVAWRQAPVDVGAACRALVATGRPLRLGAYGDPAALPVELLRQLTAAAVRWTGYTHAWRRFPEVQPFVMASVDTEAEAAAAAAAGWRYFRAAEDGQPLPGEVLCPASGPVKRTTCARCGLCAGTSRPARSVYIPAH